VILQVSVAMRGLAGRCLLLILSKRVQVCLAVQTAAESAALQPSRQSEQRGQASVTQILRAAASQAGTVE